MYQKQFFTLEQGAAFCNISQLAFMQELGARNIQWHYDVDDLHEDLHNIESLRDKK